MADLTPIKCTGLLHTNKNIYFCPNCGFIIINSASKKIDIDDTRHKNYCSNCGTHLDWSNCNTIGAVIDKVQFLSDKFNIVKELLNKLSVHDIDTFVLKYFLFFDNEDKLKLVRDNIFVKINEFLKENDN